MSDMCVVGISISLKCISQQMSVDLKYKSTKWLNRLWIHIHNLDDGIYQSYTNAYSMIWNKIFS